VTPQALADANSQAFRDLTHLDEHQAITILFRNHRAAPYRLGAGFVESMQDNGHIYLGSYPAGTPCATKRYYQES